jgi:hypothetical protein
MRALRGSFLTAALCAATVLAGCSRQPSSQETQQWDAELQRLQTEQDSLRARAADLVKADPFIAGLPEGDAVIRIPTSFIRIVLEKVFQDVAGNVTLRLGGIKAHVENTVKKVITIGKFTVDVDIQEVVGKLGPQKPDVYFTGGKIGMKLPVNVTSGYGKAKIHFVWDGKNVAGVACGDMDVTQVVTGNVIPSKYVVAGTLGLGMKGNQVLCTPHFPETKLNIRVTPTKESWAAVDSLLGTKSGPCAWVLGKVNVHGILENVVQNKGFNVKLPLSDLKPFVIPAGIRDSVSVGKRTLVVEASSNSVRVDPDAILYSASVALK